MAKVTLSSAVTLNGGDAAIVKGAIAFLRRIYGNHMDPWIIDDAAGVAADYHDFNYLPSLVNASSKTNSQSLAGKAARKAQAVRERAPARLHPLSPIRQKVISHIHNSNLLAATGGTYLVDNYAWWRRLPEYETALRGNVPLVFLTQSVGPLRGPTWAIRRLRRVLEYATIVMARDTRTTELLYRIAPNANVVLAPDMAFALADEIQPVQPSDRRLDGATRVALSVREWRHFTDTSYQAGMEQYRRSLADAVTRLVREQQAYVTFVSTCQGIAEYPYDDSRVAAQIVEKLDPDVASNVEVDRAFIPPMELVQKFSSFDVVVSTRMHGAILSWIAGIPVVAIAYESKTADLFAKHNLEGLVHPMEKLESRRLVEAVADVRNGADDALSARRRAEAEALILADIATMPEWSRVNRSSGAGR